MLFNSYFFLFIFLPLALLGWYTLNHFHRYRLACAFLCGMSLWFYAYFNIKYLLIILVSIGMNYGISALLEFVTRKSVSLSQSVVVRRIFLLLGVFANLALFFYFKYYDFFIENINALFHSDFNLKHILLPLGISFFTFQQLSFIIDRAKGDAKHYSFLNYVTFVTFFPQLIAGPIVLYDEMMPQFEDVSNRKWNWERFQEGAVLFILGLSKKVLLADALAIPANYGFTMTYYLDTLSVLLVVLSYTFELYFDFSGYCDMAMGIGKMFGIDLPINFDSPYKACSVKELWSKWHMTLTRFFTRYIYFPLGGSRKGAARTALNTLIVFALSGLWHGANWTFVLWGITEGLLVIWDNLGIVAVKGIGTNTKPAHYLLRKTPLITIPRLLGGFFTFFSFMLSLFFFRSQSVTYALQMFKKLFTPLWPGFVLRTANMVEIKELYIVTKAVTQVAPSLSSYCSLGIWLLLLVISSILIFKAPTARTVAANAKPTTRMAFGLAILFVWCVCSLSQVSTFLYFNF